MYNLTITYHGVGTAFFAWPDIQAHTTAGNASYNIFALPTTKLLGDGSMVYLNNSQSISGQVAYCFNDTTSVTSISVTSGVILDNVADPSRYSTSLYDKTENIPDVSSSLSILSQYSGLMDYYPNVTLDEHQIDCEIKGWTSASGVSASPISINDPFVNEDRAASPAFIYTNQVISEKLKISDGSASYYFTLDRVTGNNILVNANDLPLSTEQNGYFYVTVYITGPAKPTIGPLVIELTGTMTELS